MKYYDVRDTLNAYPNAHYYVIFGERSNGKTYSSLDYALDNYITSGEQFAYVRRWGEDIRKKQLSQLFAAHAENGRIAKLTKNAWGGMDYTGNKFRLTKSDEDGKLTIDDDICGYAFDLNSMEHYKSISFPRITTIIFDEFLSRNGYLPNEFILFTNVISTIVRQRNNVKIIMLGNTVNRSCPYFSEMGLSHIKEQDPGTIDVYHYGDSGLEVITEYCSPTSKRGGKKSDVYFAFDNPELQMITKGAWEIAIYPHKPCKFVPRDIDCVFFIEFENEMLQCECVTVDTGPFIFIHRKTTPIKKPDEDIVYTTRPSERWNYRMCLTKQTDVFSRKIIAFFRENRVFYADNEVGEIVRNYLIWSDMYSIKN